MPELPEVETIVKGLNLKVLNRTFINVWTDSPGLIKSPKNFDKFKKEIINRKIKKISRRGKNIIFELSGNFILLAHQKMTGHFLVGKWKIENKKWKPLKKGFFQDPANRYIHLMFRLDNGKMLALSDLRKFAKVGLWKKEEFNKLKDISELGPEPLEKNFTFEKFKKCFKWKTPQQIRGKIKQVLIDQKIIAGIGNIYSDEILWRAKIHPLKSAPELKEDELKAVYDNIKKVLKIGIKLGGESISDFRNIEGKKGAFDKERKVYRREGGKCQRCGLAIKRLKIGGRSAHFCPNCQKL